MKPLFLLLSACFFSFASAQPVWDWARTAGGIQSDGVFDVCTTPDGYAYTTGIVEHNVTFGPFTLPGPSNTYEMFIAKYAPWGDCLWAIRCPYAFIGWSIGVDASGDVYVWAQTAAGFSILKYDASGNLLWTRVVGQHYVSIDMAVNESGTVLVTGTAEFGGIALGQDTVRQDHTFLARYDSSGAMTGLREIGRHSRFQSRSIAQDNAGAVFLAGSIYGADTIDQYSFAFPYSDDANFCTIKLDAQLSTEWIVTSEGPSRLDQDAFNICADHNGGCYVTAAFNRGFSNAGYEVLQGDTLSTDTSAWQLAMAMLVHLDMNGNRDWLLGSSFGSSLAFDAVATDGQHVYLSGHTSTDSLTFGSTGFNLPGVNEARFLFSTDNSGNSTIPLLISDAARVVSIKCDTAGGIYTAGWHSYYSPVFGNNVLPVAQGVSDIFIAKLRTGPVGIQNTEPHTDVQMRYQQEHTWQLQLGETQVLADHSVLDLYDMNGRVVKTISITSSRTAIDCSDLASGMYAWHLHGNSTTLASGKISVW